jgi:hypothetical protein
VRALIKLALDPANSSTLRAVAFEHLDEVTSDMLKKEGGAAQASVDAFIVKMIRSADDRFLEETGPGQLRVPDGSPIGGLSEQADGVRLHCGER